MNAITSAVRVEQIGNATLYLGDCRDVLPTLGEVDCIVTDPPYGMKWDGKITSGRNTTSATKPGSKTKHYGVRIVGDDIAPDLSALIASRECIVWGANHLMGQLPSGGMLVWVKRNDEGFGSFLSDAEVAWFNFGTGVYCFRHTGDARGKAPGGGALTRWHPNQKPVQLMAWCIDKTRGEVVIDPFMGSGTTGVAAVQRGRRFVGCEIDPTYFEAACQRIAEAQRHADMFAALPKEDPSFMRTADLFAPPED